MSDRDKRVVLVTGASSGIGLAIAGHLSRQGWRVFGTSRKPYHNADFDMIAMDVDDEASVKEGVAHILAQAGRLDAVINNAGIAVMGAVEDTGLTEAKTLFETNFFGVLRVCRAALPTMRHQGSGTIVNISSLSGVFGTPFSGLYSASKFAVEGLTEALRLEVRRFGIKVVLVEPGDHDSQLPMRRTIAAEAEGNPAYAEAFARFKTVQAKDEAKAPKPDGIARLVARVLTHPNPRMRYTVGLAGQRIVSLLKRFLPSRLYERVLRSALGV